MSNQKRPKSSNSPITGQSNNSNFVAQKTFIINDFVQAIIKHGKLTGSLPPLLQNALYKQTYTVSSLLSKVPILSRWANPETSYPIKTWQDLYIFIQQGNDNEAKVSACILEPIRDLNQNIAPKLNSDSLQFIQDLASALQVNYIFQYDSKQNGLKTIAENTENPQRPTIAIIVPIKFIQFRGLTQDDIVQSRHQLRLKNLQRQASTLQRKVEQQTSETQPLLDAVTRATTHVDNARFSEDFTENSSSLSTYSADIENELDKMEFDEQKQQSNSNLGSSTQNNTINQVNHEQIGIFDQNIGENEETRLLQQTPDKLFNTEPFDSDSDTLVKINIDTDHTLNPLQSDTTDSVIHGSTPNLNQTHITEQQVQVEDFAPETAFTVTTPKLTQNNGDEVINYNSSIEIELKDIKPQQNNPSIQTYDTESATELTISDGESEKQALSSKDKLQNQSPHEPGITTQQEQVTQPEVLNHTPEVMAIQPTSHQQVAIELTKGNRQPDISATNATYITEPKQSTAPKLDDAQSTPIYAILAQQAGSDVSIVEPIANRIIKQAAQTALSAIKDKCLSFVLDKARPSKLEKEEIIAIYLRPGIDMDVPDKQGIKIIENAYATRLAGFLLTGKSLADEEAKKVHNELEKDLQDYYLLQAAEPDSELNQACIREIQLEVQKAEHLLRSSVQTTDAISELLDNGQQSQGSNESEVMPVWENSLSHSNSSDIDTEQRSALTGSQKKAAEDSYAVTTQSYDRDLDAQWFQQGIELEGIPVTTDDEDKPLVNDAESDVTRNTVDDVDKEDITQQQEAKQGIEEQVHNAESTDDLHLTNSTTQRTQQDHIVEIDPNGKQVIAGHQEFDDYFALIRSNPAPLFDNDTIMQEDEPLLSSSQQDVSLDGTASQTSGTKLLSPIGVWHQDDDETIRTSKPDVEIKLQDMPTQQTLAATITQSDDSEEQPRNIVDDIAKELVEAPFDNLELKSENKADTTQQQEVIQGIEVHVHNAESTNNLHLTNSTIQHTQQDHIAEIDLDGEQVNERALQCLLDIGETYNREATQLLNAEVTEGSIATLQELRTNLLEAQRWLQAGSELATSSSFAEVYLQRRIQQQALLAENHHKLTMAEVHIHITDVNKQLESIEQALENIDITKQLPLPLEKDLQQKLDYCSKQLAAYTDDEAARLKQTLDQANGNLATMLRNAEFERDLGKFSATVEEFVNKPLTSADIDSSYDEIQHQAGALKLRHIEQVNVHQGAILRYEPAQRQKIEQRLNDLQQQLDKAHLQIDNKLKLQQQLDEHLQNNNKRWEERRKERENKRRKKHKEWLARVDNEFRELTGKINSLATRIEKFDDSIRVDENMLESNVEELAQELLEKIASLKYRLETSLVYHANNEEKKASLNHELKECEDKVEAIKKEQLRKIPQDILYTLPVDLLKAYIIKDKSFLEWFENLTPASRVLFKTAVKDIENVIPRRERYVYRKALFEACQGKLVLLQQFFKKYPSVDIAFTAQYSQWQKFDREWILYKAKRDDLALIDHDPRVKALNRASHHILEQLEAENFAVAGRPAEYEKRLARYVKDMRTDLFDLEKSLTEDGAKPSQAYLEKRLDDELGDLEKMGPRITLG
jgi:hypothetical protein